MNHHWHVGVAVLRPWPFGPPLRGRAPHRDADMQLAPMHERYDAAGATPASAPAGGLASTLRPSSLI